MKKGIYLLITLVVSLFVFSGRVEAAKELTCVYEGGLASNGKMLVQDSKGKITILTTFNDDSYIEHPAWAVLNLAVASIDSKFYKNNELSNCPEYSSALPASGKGKVHFYDENKFAKADYKLVDSYEKIHERLNEFNEIARNTNSSAQELVCIYDNNASSLAKMLIQEKTGELKLYIADGKAELSNPKWKLTESYFPKLVKTKYYDADNTGYLTGCPTYSSGVAWSGQGNVYFGDQKGSFTIYKETVNFNLKKVDEYDYLPDNLTSGHYYEFSSSTNYSEQINNNKWIGKCVYGVSDTEKLYLYFNEDTVIIDNKLKNRCTSRTYFTLNDLLAWDSCPRLYEYYFYSTLPNADKLCSVGQYYIDAKKAPKLGVKQIGDNIFVSHQLTYLEGSVESIRPVEPNEPIDDCKDLFGDELVKRINSIMNIIKIAVPILLIGFGILDFTKAIFAGSDDDMTKSKSKFFKRIIAAVLVFIAPIFINLILTLANEVWGNISPDSCVSQSE